MLGVGQPGPLALSAGHGRTGNSVVDGGQWVGDPTGNPVVATTYYKPLNIFFGSRKDLFFT